MEITLGDKIKINGEEVPEYLLKALYENLKIHYPEQVGVRGGCINCDATKATSFPPNATQITAMPLQTSRHSNDPVVLYNIKNL